MGNEYELNSSWTFNLHKSSANILKDQRFKSEKKYPAEVPGTIHTDLLDNNLIENPFYSDNELRLKWIPLCDWVYQTKFDYKGNADNNVDLVFKGLDTISEIYLNHKKLGTTGNMFLTYRYDIKNILKPSDNYLQVIFRSPVQYAIEMEKKYGRLPVALNSSRVYIRKAQYSFGWDWGPTFPTAGIWRKVYVHEYSDAMIENLTFKTKAIKRRLADVEAGVFVKNPGGRKYSLRVSLNDRSNTYVKNISIKSSGEYKIGFKINEPELWWPNGEGKQSLLLLKAEILGIDDFILDQCQKDVGIRTIKLVLKEKGNSTFKLRINNRDIYSKGVNWIPADSFLPRVTQQKYSELLSAAKEANINIVRVWGGGIYEDDEFYNLCNRLGLLVWQDFMFACASYPEFKDFISNVKEEVTQNVLRLQHNPCIVLWCGNNENEWIWTQEQKTSSRFMPGFKIYHKIIPDILEETDPDRPYWPSSPYGDVTKPNSSDIGNTHQWDIWSRWIDYNQVKNDNSLFVTEFGFQGPANKVTLEKCLPDRNRRITDRIFEHHNKQIEGPERILKFLGNHLPVRSEWNDYIYLSQLNQSFALKTCIEYWRTNKRTNGSIIWQLNDCWPVTSWSVIDSSVYPKLSYFFVKNAFAPFLMSFEDEGNKIIVKLLNQNQFKGKGKLRLAVISTLSGEIKKDISIKVNISNKEYAEIYSLLRKDLPDNDQWIITAVLFDNANGLISRNYYLTIPWKHVKLKKSEIRLTISQQNKNIEVSLEGNQPAFFVDLYHPDFTFSNRGFFMMPDEKIILNIKEDKNDKLDVDDIKIYTLNRYLQD